MKIVLEVDGCKNCPYNVFYMGRNTLRVCKITGTKMSIEDIQAMALGATLINCPRERIVKYETFIRCIIRRYCE